MVVHNKLLQEAQSHPQGLLRLAINAFKRLTSKFTVLVLKLRIRRETIFQQVSHFILFHDQVLSSSYSDSNTILRNSWLYIAFIAWVEVCLPTHSILIILYFLLKFSSVDVLTVYGGYNILRRTCEGIRIFKQVTNYE
jgi:hypothetical protein